jgi:hypothetical protein
MNHVERVTRVMSFQPVDRLPMIEWAGWWHLTVQRWHTEGLPAQMDDAFEIRAHLGLDPYHQLWIGARAPGCPDAAGHGVGIIANMDDYRRIRPFLYPQAPTFDHAMVRGWGERQQRGDLVVWLTLEGYFWFPRGLFGITPHLYAFYDQPELMHQINQDLTAYNLRVLDEFCNLCQPSFMTFAEDLSYNHGPMLSKPCFDEFLAPYYRQIIPAILERGIVPMIDSDGDITPLIPWFEGVGLQGILPLERMAGVDVAQIRQLHSHWRMIGAFDKTVMHKGEGAMRQEFERLLPVMRTGGFIPSVDHQTPPDVSLDTYRVYLRLLREYAEKGAQ